MTLRPVGRIVVTLALLIQSCGGDSMTTSESSLQPTRIWLAAERLACEGVGPQDCLQIKYAEEDDWELLYDEIAGFDHVAGTEYILEVEITENLDPPADGSSLSYRLVRVTSSIRR